MKKQLSLTFALGLLLMGMGCGPTPPPPVTFRLDRPFSLKVGQSGETADVHGLSLHFVKVAADSRCPRNVECITAGQADVVLDLKMDAETKTVTLPFTLPNGTTNVTEFKGYTIRVVGVMPFKVKDKPILPEEYVITLNVIPTPPPAPKIKLGEDFTLKPGDRMEVEENATFAVRLDSVTSDSRCPADVKCIWAGRADCAVSLIQGESVEKGTVSTGDMSKGGKGEAVFGPYLLKIRTLEPTPKQGQTIPQKDYKATFVLTKQ